MTRRDRRLQMGLFSGVTCGQAARLRRAGWTAMDRDEALWRDPAGGAVYSAREALRVMEKDRARGDEVAS